MRIRNPSILAHRVQAELPELHCGVAASCLLDTQTGLGDDDDDDDDECGGGGGGGGSEVVVKMMVNDFRSHAIQFIFYFSFPVLRYLEVFGLVAL